MRSFPRTARRRSAAASAAAALAVGLLTVPASPQAHAEDLKDKQNRVEKKIGRAHTDFDHSSRRFRRASASLSAAQGRLATAQTRLAAAEGRLSAARLRDQRMQEKLALAVDRLREAGRAVEAAGQQLEDQREHVSDVISNTYEEGDPQLLAFASFLDARDPADLTRRAEARRVVVGEETRVYDEFRAAEVLLVVQEDQVEAYRDEVSRRRERAAEHLARMKVLKAAAVDARQDVFRLLKQRYRAQARANAARRADLRVLTRLRAEKERISDLLRRRAEAARRQASAGRVRSGDGYLGYPVSGGITSPYGYRTHPIYGYYSLHDGTDFGAGCGAPLYAGAPGRVVSSYYQTAYGNRLIIDHGAVRGVGLATIYNHAVRYTVAPGQRVQRGEIVGYVGSTGWSTGCHLHFSVVVNGSTVDPAGWL